MLLQLWAKHVETLGFTFILFSVHFEAMALDTSAAFVAMWLSGTVQGEHAAQDQGENAL